MATGHPVIAGLAWLLDPASWRGENGLAHRLVEHVGLSALSLLVAVLVALPVALWLGHRGTGGTLAMNIGNVGRAVPTFAVLVLLALAPRPFGATTLSFVLALVAFGIPPLLTNTYVGMREVDRDTVEAARGMGMSGWQVLTRVELALATPLLLNGVRLAAVQIVATASVVGLVSGGALGRVITTGYARQDLGQITGGAVLVTALALLVEVLLGRVQRRAARRRPGRGTPPASRGNRDRLMTAPDSRPGALPG